MKVIFQALALALALASLTQTSDAAEQCKLPTNTLLFDECAKTCQPSEPCTATASVSGDCKLECLQPYLTSPKTGEQEFWLVVPYGKWKSSQELASKTPLPASVVDDPIDAAVKSNDDLVKIASMKLTKATTRVVIRGGSSTWHSVKGRVANVEVPADLLAASPQVKVVQLDNLNLGLTADKLVASLPKDVQDLTLGNDLIEAFPSSVASLSALKTLDLRNNSISKISAPVEMKALTTLMLMNNDFVEFPAGLPKTLKILSLNHNAITSVPTASGRDTLEKLNVVGNQIAAFDAAFQDLKHLDLSHNKLTAIPPVVFTLKSLKTLYLDGNPIKDATLTREQADALQRIESFSIEKSAIRTNCAVADQMKIKQFTFCLTGSAATKSAHHHKSHHKSHHVAQLPPHAKPVSLLPAVESNTTLPVFMNSNSNSNTRSSATKDSNDSRSDDNTLVVALSSAAGGFVAAIVLVFAVVAVKKRRRAAMNKAATEEIKDAKAHGQSGKTPHGVQSV